MPDSVCQQDKARLHQEENTNYKAMEAVLELLQKEHYITSAEKMKAKALLRAEGR